MAIITTATLPVTSSYDDAGVPGLGGAIRDLVANYNALYKQQAALALAFTSDGVLKATVLSRGTTVTMSTAACTITIAGVPVAIAASANTALGTLGTLTADTWGVIAVDAVAAGTITFVVSANFATGFATEALAIADTLANNGKTANKARIGYATIKTKAANTWIAATDSLAGGATGNVASITNYYSIASPWDIAADTANAITLGSIALSAKQIGTMSGTALVG